MEATGTDECAAVHNDDDEHYCVRSDPVLTLILTNLPPKPLFSFKSVSKRWDSLISSPYFAKTYTAANGNTLLDASNSPPWALLRRRSHDGALHQEEGHSATTTTISTVLSKRLPSKDQLTVAVSDSPFPVPSKERYQIVSSSNGLLLCRLIVGDTTYHYAICNPVTAQWTVLPPYECCWNNVSEAFVTKLEPSSLNVVGYKVILLQYDPGIRGVRSGIKYWDFKERFDMAIYNPETKEWTNSQLRFSFTYHVEGTTRPVCLNGMVHWKVWLPCTCMADVAVYDPNKGTDQELRLIKYPTIDEHSGWDDDYNHIHTLIDAIHGKLHYLAIDQNIQVLALWVLEDYHEDEWILKHRFDLSPTTSKMLSVSDYCKPLAFHPCDSNIIYLITNEKCNKVMSYDISKEVVSPVRVSFPIHQPDEVFPFVVPLWPLIIDC